MYKQCLENRNAISSKLNFLEIFQSRIFYIVILPKDILYAWVIYCIRYTVYFFRLVPGYFVYRGPDEIEEYYIYNISSYKTQVCNTDYIFASMSFKRSLLSFFLSVCLPTIIANLIGHMTNYFGSHKFDVAVGVNLTLLLVLTTM
jgi:hypothetical protein